jgi:hypothetical protein
VNLNLTPVAYEEGYKKALSDFDEFLQSILTPNNNEVVNKIINYLHCKQIEFTSDSTLTVIKGGE